MIMSKTYNLNHINEIRNTSLEQRTHGTSQQSLCKCDLSVVGPPPVLVSGLTCL